MKSISRVLKIVLFVVCLFPAVLVQATTLTYFATLTGAAEAPPNGSAGTGMATVVYDDAAHTLQLDVSFSGLMGTTSASHIHCCTALAGTGTASVATTLPSFPGFPLGVTSGAYSQLLDLSQTSSFSAAFITANGGTVAGAEATLVSGLASGQAYLNIHTSIFTGGEIRGFLTPVVVPVPAALWLFGSGLLGLVAVVRHRK